VNIAEMTLAVDRVVLTHEHLRVLFIRTDAGWPWVAGGPPDLVAPRDEIDEFMSLIWEVPSRARPRAPEPGGG
jgi:hypothetical protein